MLAVQIAGRGSVTNPRGVADGLWVRGIGEEVREIALFGQRFLLPFHRLEKEEPVRLEDKEKFLVVNCNNMNMLEMKWFLKLIAMDVHRDLRFASTSNIEYPASIIQHRVSSIEHPASVLGFVFWDLEFYLVSPKSKHLHQECNSAMNENATPDITAI